MNALPHTADSSYGRLFITRSGSPLPTLRSHSAALALAFLREIFWVARKMSMSLAAHGPHRVEGRTRILEDHRESGNAVRQARALALRDRGSLERKRLSASMTAFGWVRTPAIARQVLVLPEPTRHDRDLLAGATLKLTLSTAVKYPSATLYRTVRFLYIQHRIRCPRTRDRRRRRRACVPSVFALMSASSVVIGCGG